MSARKLPFVVQPRLKAVKERLGTEDSGIIEIERRGYITVGEKAMVDQSMQGSNAVAKLRSLVANIAETEEKDVATVMGDLTSSDSPEYLEAWITEATECFAAIGIEGEKRDMLQATALLISRVDDEWTIEDTMQLHGELVRELSKFYDKENSGAVAELEEEPKSSGAEGKG